MLTDPQITGRLDPDDPLVQAILAELQQAQAEPGLELQPYAEWEEDLTQIEEDRRAEGRAEAPPPVEDAGVEDATVWEMMRASLAFFSQEVLTGPNEAPYRGRFLIGDHHLEWEELLLEHQRLSILAPRDHGKTFFFDFAYPLWQAVFRPGSCGFIFSATQEQAIRILSDIKAEIETNPRLRHLLPAEKKGGRWSATAIQCSNGARIYARGFGTKVRGAHPDWIVVDDGLNDETAYSELVRKKQIDYFYSAISNMLVPGGQLIVVGTPFHAEDLYADLKNNEEYHFQKYQALSDETEEPLWEERYDKVRLEAKRREIGSVRFTREFQCEPISDDMSLFPLYLFQGEQVEQPTVSLGMPLEFWKDKGITDVYMGVDYAISSSAGADYTVIWVMGRDKWGNRWIMDIVRGHGVAYQKQQSKVVELARLYQPCLIFLEANQMQRIFGDELIRTSDLPIKPFVTGVEKNTLDKGVPSLRVLLENGKVKIPRGDKRSVEMTNLWRDEMRNFTYADGKLQSVGAHDDTVMAFWLCDQAIRTGGFTFDFGDDVGYSEEGATETTDMDTVMKELTEDTPPPEEKSTFFEDPTLDLPPMAGFGAPSPSSVLGSGVWE
jgi:phage terminase large subunit-like protein